MLKLVGFHPNNNYNVIMQSSNCLLIITLKLKKSISKLVITREKKKILAPNIPRPNSSLLESSRLLDCCWKKNGAIRPCLFCRVLKYSDVRYITCWVKWSHLLLIECLSGNYVSLKKNFRSLLTFEFKVRKGSELQAISYVYMETCELIWTVVLSGVPHIFFFVFHVLCITDRKVFYV